MATHDYNLANQDGASFRSDLNNALAAIVSNNSSSTAPATTFAHQIWVDTTANVIKQRNAANDAWVELWRIDGGFNAKTFSSNVTLNAQSDLRFADSDSSNWVAFQAPATVSSNVTWTLPASDGTSGQVIETNGSGVLSWADAGGVTDNITEGNTSAEVVDTGSDGHFKVVTEGTEAVRVDSSRRLLVGTTSDSNNAKFVVAGNVAGATGGGEIVLKRPSTVSNTDGVGGIRWFDNNGEFAQIYAYGDATTGASDYPGRLVFSTTADGASSPTERMRIKSDGKIGIGTTSPSTLLQIGDGSTGNGVPQLRLHRGSGSDYLNIDCSGGSAHLDVVGGGYMNLTMGGTDKLRVRDDGDTAVYTTRTDGTCIQADSSGAANTTAITFAGKHSSTGVHTGTLSFKVTTNGNVTNTNNSYGSLSDIKLKENIVDAGSQWDDLKAIQVRNYNFKEETGHQTHTQLGVIAQEIELVSPGLVTETPDRDDDNNDLGTTTKSVNYSVLYMKAVKALQEAMERIETLETANASQAATIAAFEARLTALEGGA